MSTDSPIPAIHSNSVDAEYESLEQMRRRFDFETYWSLEVTKGHDLLDLAPDSLQGCMYVTYGDEMMCRLPARPYSWLDLWKAADNIYGQLGPYDDHCFIELFTPKKITIQKKTINVLELFLGS